MKKLIINADDFGLSRVFNETILDLLEKGYIKSTDVLVTENIFDQKDQVERLIDIYKSKSISIALHFDFGDKENTGTYKNEIKKELKKQSDKFFSIFGFLPDHIDKHKWIYSECEAKAMVDFAKEKNIPIRNSMCGMIEKYKNEVKTSDEVAFFATEKSFEEIQEFLKKLEDNKVYEMITHPGEYDSNCSSSLNAERNDDYDNIVKMQLVLKEKNIKVISWKEI